VGHHDKVVDGYPVIKGGWGQGDGSERWVTCEVARAAGRG
jgi:hypothetical protein